MTAATATAAAPATSATMLCVAIHENMFSKCCECVPSIHLLYSLTHLVETHPKWMALAPATTCFDSNQPTHMSTHSRLGLSPLLCSLLALSHSISGLSGISNSFPATFSTLRAKPTSLARRKTCAQWDKSERKWIRIGGGRMNKKRGQYKRLSFHNQYFLFTLSKGLLKF